MDQKSCNFPEYFNEFQGIRPPSRDGLDNDISTEIFIRSLDISGMDGGDGGRPKWWPPPFVYSVCPYIVGVLEFLELNVLFSLK